MERKGERGREAERVIRGRDEEKERRREGRNRERDGHRVLDILRKEETLAGWISECPSRLLFHPCQPIWKNLL
jgi:hypothetical protein